MDDLIDRQEAIDAITAQKGVVDKSIAKRVLYQLPSAQPERKKGKWIDNKGLYQCSCCKHIWSELWWVESCPIDRMNKIMRFCPKCGAQMDGGKAEYGEIHCGADTREETEDE